MRPGSPVRGVVAATVVCALVLSGALGSGAPPASAPGGAPPAFVFEPAPLPEDLPTGTVRVAIDAARGPKGAPGPVEIDRRFYGMNVADWSPKDYRPAPHPEYLAYLKALAPGVLRWPAGHTSQEYAWARDGDAPKGTKRVLSPDHVEDFLALARAVGAMPLLAVNLKTGTPEAAADLVRYVNVERGHGVRWWQIGNEPDHRDGLTASPGAYAERYLKFARAMRAVDPSIRLVGAELMTGADVLASNGHKDWLTPILQIAGREMDAVSWHYYPLDGNQPDPRSSASPTIEHLFQESARDWKPAGLAFADEIFPRLKAARDALAPGAEVWITEFAEDSGKGGAFGIADRLAGALWAADALGRFAAHGPDAIVKFVFKSGRTHAFTLLDENYQPRPEYYTYWLYARHFGNRVVGAESDAIERVSAHAALREDGALAVVLVNKGERAETVRLAIDGFTPRGAERYTLTGAGYDAVEVALNGEQLTPAKAATGIAPERAGAAREMAVDAPPLAVTMLVLRPA